MFIFDRNCRKRIMSSTLEIHNGRRSRYFDSKSFVLRMMNFVTSPPNSFSFFSLASLMASLASASLPRMIAFSKFFLNSFFEPRKFGLAKLRSEKYSERSFYNATVREKRRVNFRNELGWAFRLG
jgi:hypothetical protein